MFGAWGLRAWKRVFAARLHYVMGGFHCRGPDNGVGWSLTLFCFPCDDSGLFKVAWTCSLICAFRVCFQGQRCCIYRQALWGWARRGGIHVDLLRMFGAVAPRTTFDVGENHNSGRGTGFTFTTCPQGARESRYLITISDPIKTNLTRLELVT
jgi:hypothetical protein